MEPPHKLSVPYIFRQNQIILKACFKFGKNDQWLAQNNIRNIK